MGGKVPLRTWQDRMGEEIGGHAAISLQSVIRANNWVGSVDFITLKQGHI